MQSPDTLWNAPLEDLKKGYTRTGETLVCLFCGRSAEQGLIYAENGVFYEAEKYMRRHIETEHGSSFRALIGLDKKSTGLTDHQNALLRLFYEGRSDDEIKNELGIGSASTIRNHRFVLKEKERQARIFLALMELLKEGGGSREPAFIAPHPRARMIDDRYNLTDEEEREILGGAFPNGPDGPLRTFDLKEKQRLAVLRHIAARLDDERLYTEKEINAALEPIYADYAILRRFLIEYGFLDREPDGSVYWTTQGGRPLASSVVSAPGSDRPADKQKARRALQTEPKNKTDAPARTETEEEELPMNRRKELQAMYKEMKQEAGIYRIRHKESGRSFVASLPNLKSMDGRRFELNAGSFQNKELQRDWKEYGEDAFEFEVLEVLEPSENPYVTTREQLGELETKWLGKLKPYGERGYNRRPSE
ncbi:DUF2087 domain-containing protein [Saccharibacillus alkalitolerans]|uniref:DUF2087 domain-containing protein n=1 Tax=Saccharibacillus alkalitolerans TaxID=2705290 RepID=A0ABX0F5F4_9BACL|nr:DUF2087 domain-containing protein [Saccharibacillus alkalitolerans]NGZ76176.1 DUF2087 domain-containing protein [Saccharibacillus alkalitolerans]